MLLALLDGERRYVTVAVRVIAATALVVLVAACGSSSSLQGTGDPASQTRSLRPFTSVELAGSNSVTIHVGGKQDVVVRADRDLLDRVTTTVREGRLVIANTPGGHTSRTPTSVEITMPSLTALRLSGSGIISAYGVDASRVAVALPGSGIVSADGKASRLDVTLGGSGVARLGALSADDVRAVLGGSGTIFVRATGSLRASVSGSGSILYLGRPGQLTSSVTGSGAVRQIAEVTGT